MIELKHICKVYKLKRSEPVNALKDVSIKFGDKGLVFILGKSGSGKSTLLNVMGGLDTATSGEIIIKEKSSKDFSQSDFDSYRNTYLGFIFQEYNILEDFSIGENIGLALKLQGKKATPDAINSILKEVDLDGYYRRKPNELSGGQKQRVAIARALVKNPEIILADEPTGALDSKTGAQVFSTLKKLSKDKLVIVVSHDREFAERYGDRVVEFKDGEIISDTEKISLPAEKKGDGVNSYGDKLFRFPKGYRLTEKDVAVINARLKTGEAYFTTDENINKDIRFNSLIDEDGNMQTFVKTDEDKITGKNSVPFKLIKSRMPLKESFKMGASGLKAKPFRLVTTVFMCLICFTLFGLLDSFAAYNSEKAITESMITADANYVSVVKQRVETRRKGDKYYTATDLNQSDLQTLANGTGKKFFGVYGSSMDFSSSVNEYSYTFGEVYANSLHGYLEITPSDFSATGLSVTGRLPENYDEVAVSDYVFEIFKRKGYKRYDGTDVLAKGSVSSAQTFLSANRYIYIGGKEYKITGVINTGVDFTYYDEKLKNEIAKFIVEQSFGADLQYGYTGALFVKDGFVKDVLGVEETGRTYSSAIGVANSDRDIRKMANYVFDSETEYTRYSVYNSASVLEDEIGDLIIGLAEVFKYLAIGTLVFSVLLFMNYINTSISYKKREIGILRAVGARKSDVFGVFFNESLIIAGITFLISALSSGIIVILINGSLRTKYGLPITVLSFGIRQIASLIAVGIGTAFVSSFLPVMKIARKKPIDAIRNK